MLALCCISPCGFRRFPNQYQGSISRSPLGCRTHAWCSCAVCGLHESKQRVRRSNGREAKHQNDACEYPSSRPSPRRKTPHAKNPEGTPLHKSCPCERRLDVKLVHPNKPGDEQSEHQEGAEGTRAREGGENARQRDPQERNARQIRQRYQHRNQAQRRPRVLENAAWTKRTGAVGGVTRWVCSIKGLATLRATRTAAKAR